VNIPLHKDILLKSGRTIQALRIIDATYENLDETIDGQPMLVEIQWLGGYGWERSTIPYMLLLDFIKF